MKMNDYINAFTEHLSEALEIGRSAKLNHCQKEIRNVLICGLGGSGIGGTILVDLVSPKVRVPICATKDYTIPNFVDKHTLIIASSYSGNTEETLFALEKCQARGAEIACVSSGGRLAEIAKEKDYNFIEIPSGHPLEQCLGIHLHNYFSFSNIMG